MRIESSVMSVSWIPSEAVTGMTKLPFEVGVTHYDNPPPDVIDDLEGLGAADGFRFANRLRAWIEVAGGQIIDHGYAGGAVMGSTTVRLGKQATFQAVGFPELQRDPEVTPTSVRFVQTAGGRPAIPAPRRVRHPPFVQLKGPTVWTTLGLTIGVDGSHKSQITNPGQRAHIEPAFSPSGNKIAFENLRNEFSSRIATMRRDGSHRRALTPGGATNTRPSWQPL